MVKLLSKVEAYLVREAPPQVTEPVRIPVSPDPADQIIIFVRDKFASGQWRFLAGARTDGRNRYCMIGALHEAADRLRLTNWYDQASDRVEAVLPSGGYSIPAWNDNVASLRADPERALIEVLERAVIGVK